MVSFYAATYSPDLGIVIMSLYAIWWAISLWQCARNASFRSLKILTRGLLLLALVGGAAHISGLIVLREDNIPLLLNILGWLLGGQFLLIYIVTFFTGFAATLQVRVSSELSQGMHRARAADLGIQELPDDQQRRERAGARFLEEGTMYPGDVGGNSHGMSHR